MPTSIAVVYHSGYGHTEVIAEAVAEGARSVEGVTVSVVTAGEIETPDSAGLTQLDSADAMIFGAPTYMGSASAVFKTFMEATSTRWMEQKWADKLAAGFTNSGSMNGDKQNTLITPAALRATPTGSEHLLAVCLKPMSTRVATSHRRKLIARQPGYLAHGSRGRHFAGSTNEGSRHFRLGRRDAPGRGAVFSGQGQL
jgi:multimeric flavodoxin WrbA